MATLFPELVEAVEASQQQPCTSASLSAKIVKREESKNDLTATATQTETSAYRRSWTALRTDAFLNSIHTKSALGYA